MKIHCRLNDRQEEVLKGMSTTLRKNVTLAWAPPWNICILDFSEGVLIFNEFKP